MADAVVAACPGLNFISNAKNHQERYPTLKK
jgi:hypothetical protein